MACLVIGQGVGAATDHHVGAGQGVAKIHDKTIAIATAQINGVVATQAGIDVAVSTQAHEVRAATQRDMVCKIGADDVEASQAVFCRRVERQAVASGGVDRCRARCEQGVGNRQVDVAAADHHAFDVGDMVKLAAIRAGHVGVGQHVSAATTHHRISTAQRTAEGNCVVAQAQVDAVDTAARCVDHIVAGARRQRVVATAQGDAVCIGRAHYHDAIRFRCRIERQVASAGCAGSVQCCVGH